MKFCENCGTQLQDIDKFCVKCGQPISEDIEAGHQSQSININLSASENINNIKSEKKPFKLQKSGIIAMIIGAVVLICGIAGVMIYHNIKRQVDINECITVTYDGYNGIGTAQYKFDSEKMYQQIMKAGGKVEHNDLSGLLNSSKDIYEILKNIDISLDKKDHLSNGDTIKLTVTCNEMLQDLYDVKFRYKDVDYTVENLKEPKEVDLFANLSVTFNGTNGSATVEIENKALDSYIKSLSYKASKTKKISMGDEITIHFNVSEEEALKQGYIIKEISKSYKCEQLDSYITDLASISNTALENIKKDAKDMLESYAAQKDYFTVSDYKYIGAYTLIPKSTSYNVNNMAYVIYTATVTSLRESDKNVSQTVYLPVLVKNILQKVDGSVSYNNNLTITGSSKVGSIYVSGYTDSAIMYKELITAQKDRYTYKALGDVEAVSN